MPWLSIIVTLVSFLLAGGAKKENRVKAAAIGLAAGAATYGVTHYTDWGKDNLGSIDGVVPTGSGTAVAGTTPDGKVVTPSVKDPATTGGSGFWNGVGGIISSPVGAAATGVVAGSLFGIPTKTLIIGGLLVGGFLLLRN